MSELSEVAPENLEAALGACIEFGQKLVALSAWTPAELDAWLDRREALLERHGASLPLQARNRLLEMGKILEHNGELMLKQLEDELSCVSQTQRSLVQYQFPCIEALFSSCEHDA